MKYTAKYFKESLPDWKRKKDPIDCRFFFRPLSFYGSAFAANHGISANDISYFSLLIAIVACSLYFFKSYTLEVVGAVLINVWLWLDCVDGNIARSVKKQAFGEFADGISSYTLVAFMGVSFGYTVYVNGGFLLEPGNPWAIVLGAVSSTFDTLVRLVYQKYNNTEHDLVDKGVIPKEVDDYSDTSKGKSLKVWFIEEWGIGGWLPIIILLATIFRALDIVIAYCFLYFGVSFVAGLAVYIKRAINKASKYPMND